MVQSPSWAANWFAASQEIPRISRNPKVHYRTHKRPPTLSILGQPKPVHTPTSHLLQIQCPIYLLTSWWRVLLEQLTGLQLVKKFPAFHGTRRFITALTSVRQLYLSLASPIQSIYPHHTSCRSILILSTHLKAAGAQYWQTYHRPVPTVLKSGRLNYLERAGPVRFVAGINII